MDINRANLQALFQTYSTAWQEVLESQEGDSLDFVASEFPSSTSSNLYAWLDKVPGFRKWVGDRVFNNVRGQKFEVVNQDFEDSVRLDANDIEDDQYGVYTPIIRMMAQSWLDLKREQIVEVFTSNASAFTGKALVATNHAYGKNTLNNKSTTALSASEMEAAFLTAAAWKYSDGSYVKPRFTHLVVGEKLRSTAWNIVKNQYTYDATDKVQIENPNKGRVELAIWPELTGDYDDYWYLVDASRPVKAVSLQIRKEPEPFMDTDAATVQRNGFVDFLATGRLAAAPTFPHLVFGGIVS